MRTLLACPALILSLALAACGSSDASSEPAASKTPEASSKPSVEGTFDVGGHELYLQCRGTASPTVVYLHGSVYGEGIVAHVGGTHFQKLLADEHRTCVYDRRNVGDSETVDAVQLPADALNDLRNLLAAAELEPPYVLVGASFGGLLAYLYANEHPDEVVGMVMIDAMFPDELLLEHLFEEKDTFKADSKAQEDFDLERISHYKALMAAQKYIDKEPAIPMTYLASTEEGYEDNDFDIPEYDKRILQLQAAYVDRFAPGKRIEVDAPHFMEPVVPDLIADEVRGVITSAGD